MNERLMLELVSASTGFLVLIIGLPLYLRRVPPNRFYGCRTRATLSDSRLWYDANRVCGRDLIMAGAVMVFGTLVIRLSGTALGPDTAAIATLTVLLLPLAAAIIHCLKYTGTRSSA